MFRKKILLIRFSSLGDVIQTLSVVEQLSHLDSKTTPEIHWITRTEYASLLRSHPKLNRIWSLDRKLGLAGLIKLGIGLRKEKFTHVYDAHNNLRSRVLQLLLGFPFYFLGSQKWLTKSQKRLYRFLLFQFRINLFKMPFSGQRDLLEPLAKWDPALSAIPAAPQIFPDPVIRSRLQQELPKDFIALAPSAAHALKRWPIDYWEKLIADNADKNFIVLGGPEDEFLQKLKAKNVWLCYRQFSLSESLAALSLAKLLISNDTGVMHFAEQLGLPTIALMGPAPFGFPSRPSTKILEKNLNCRPCSKHGQGPCVNKEFQKCLRDISPGEVSSQMQEILS